MNKRNRAIVILVTVLTLLLVGFAVFMLVKEYLTDGKIEKRALLCAIFIVISAIGTLVKLFTNKKPSRNSVQIYRNEYGKIIGDAFSDNKSKEKLFFKGIHEWNHSRFNSAISIFNGMLKDASTGTEKFALLFFLALCYDEMKVYDSAIRLYEEALLIKDNSSAASNLGICYEHIGAPEKATEAYERAIYSDPENPFSYNNLAQSLVRQGRYEDAIPWAKEAIKRKANILLVIIITEVN